MQQIVSNLEASGSSREERQEFSRSLIEAWRVKVGSGVEDSMFQLFGSLLAKFGFSSESPRVLSVASLPQGVDSVESWLGATLVRFVLVGFTAGSPGVPLFDGTGRIAQKELRLVAATQLATWKGVPGFRQTEIDDVVSRLEALADAAISSGDSDTLRHIRELIGRLRE